MEYKGTEKFGVQAWLPSGLAYEGYKCAKDLTIQLIVHGRH